MALRVPDQQIGQIKKFLELPEDKVKNFLDALANAGPQFNVSDLAAKIAESAQIPRDITDGMIGVLKSLYLTRDRNRPLRPLDVFIDQMVYRSLVKAEAFSQKDADVQWKTLRHFLVTALSLEQTLGTAVKAGPILTSHERIFSGAKIISDIRPIFHLNVSEKPGAAMIVHMLRITQRDDNDNEADLYFALDSNDLIAMKELLDRATEKEATLKSLIKDAGMAVVDPKSFY